MYRKYFMHLIVQIISRKIVYIFFLFDFLFIQIKIQL